MVSYGFTCGVLGPLRARDFPPSALASLGRRLGSALWGLCGVASRFFNVRLNSGAAVGSRGMVLSFAGSTEIYAAVGRVVSQWALVEEQIFQLFEILTDEPKTVAGIYFFALRNSGEQLKLTDHLFRSRPEHAPILPYWESLEKYTRWLTPHRNFVAHSPILESFGVPPKGGDPTIYQTQRTRVPNPYKPQAPPRTKDDVEQLYEAARQLHLAYLSFNGSFLTRASPDKLRRPFSHPLLEKYNPDFRTQKKPKVPPRSSRT